jgi:hypothetical protein
VFPQLKQIRDDERRAPHQDQPNNEVQRSGQQSVVPQLCLQHADAVFQSVHGSSLPWLGRNRVPDSAGEQRMGHPSHSPRGSGPIPRDDEQRHALWVCVHVGGAMIPLSAPPPPRAPR